MYKPVFVFRPRPASMTVDTECVGQDGSNVNYSPKDPMPIVPITFDLSVEGSYVVSAAVEKSGWRFELSYKGRGIVPSK